MATWTNIRTRGTPISLRSMVKRPRALRKENDPGSIQWFETSPIIYAIVNCFNYGFTGIQILCVCVCKCVCVRGGEGLLTRIRANRDWKSIQLQNRATTVLTVPVTDLSMVTCQKGPTRHAYAWQIGPFGRIPSICTPSIVLINSFICLI